MTHQRYYNPPQADAQEKMYCWELAHAPTLFCAKFQFFVDNYTKKTDNYSCVTVFLL
jgi:hypothetical protein